ncbi:MAG: DoxX family protein, partial [Acidimicrobiales bacterium]
MSEHPTTRQRERESDWQSDNAERPSMDIESESSRASEVRLGIRSNPLKLLKHVLSEPGGSQLLLRAFLGFTFSFAGLQKLANPNFFRARAPGSFDQQLLGAIATSPLHRLLSPATHAPVLVALLIAVGELAVGVGTLVGLWGRAAAVAGAILSLSFFLTVSFNDRPYYYGADIVFLFAWTPLIIARPGSWSLDAVLARRARAASAPSPATA